MIRIILLSTFFTFIGQVFSEEPYGQKVMNKPLVHVESAEPNSTLNEQLARRVTQNLEASELSILDAQLRNICRLFQVRAHKIHRVASAWTRPYPQTTPSAFFGAYGGDPFWNQHNTSALDQDIRTRAFQMNEFISKHFVVNEEAGGLKGDYKKAQDLIERYKADPSCLVSYEGTRGVRTLNIVNLLKQIQYMSMDPYQCPDLRWGFETSCDDLLPSKASSYDSLRSRAIHAYARRYGLNVSNILKGNGTVRSRYKSAIEAEISRLRAEEQNSDQRINNEAAMRTWAHTAYRFLNKFSEMPSISSRHIMKIDPFQPTGNFHKLFRSSARGYEKENREKFRSRGDFVNPLLKLIERPSYEMLEENDVNFFG